MEMGTYDSLLHGKRKVRVSDRVVEPRPFEIHVELDQERFGERVLGLHDPHGREQEVQRRPDLLVRRPTLEVLDKDASSHVEAEGRKRMHLSGMSTVSTSNDLLFFKASTRDGANTYRSGVDVADQSHNAGNLGGRGHAPNLALGADRRG